MTTEPRARRAPKLQNMGQRSRALISARTACSCSQVRCGDNPKAMPIVHWRISVRIPATCPATRSRAARSGHASVSASNVTASRKALSAAASRDRTRLIVLTDAFDDDMGPIVARVPLACHSVGDLPAADRTPCARSSRGRAFPPISAAAVLIPTSACIAACASAFTRHPRSAVPRASPDRDPVPAAEGFHRSSPAGAAAPRGRASRHRAAASSTE
jgi:hypothetical protein